MKKIYQAPETVTMKISTSMICGSNPDVALDSSSDPVEAASVESRSTNSIWEDDEE
jgi:hypothetical protein